MKKKKKKKERKKLLAKTVRAVDCFRKTPFASLSQAVYPRPGGADLRDQTCIWPDDTGLCRAGWWPFIGACGVFVPEQLQRCEVAFALHPRGCLRGADVSAESSSPGGVNHEAHLQTLGLPPRLERLEGAGGVCAAGAFPPLAGWGDTLQIRAHALGIGLVGPMYA